MNEMQLAYKKIYCPTDIPIRIMGEINYFSFELLNIEDNSEILIKENELVFNIDDTSKKVTYFSNTINNDLNLNTLLSKKRKPTLVDPVVIHAAFSYTDLKNPDSFTTPFVTFTPLICDKADLSRVNLSIDALMFVSIDLKLSELSQSAILTINEQILNFQRSFLYLNADLKSHKTKKLISLNYEMENDEVLALILPEIELNNEEKWREKISHEMKLERPLQRCQSLFPPKDVLLKLSGNGEKLINPHTKIITMPVDCHLVKGRYTYYHYMQDNFNDKGWGCAYRSLQTIVSWFVWQGWTRIEIPSHKDIQSILVRMGDKEKSFIDSRSWIGSFEINLVLQDLLKFESRIISLTKGSELANIYDQLQQHFDDCGSPVMIGGGQLAHTIIGVSKDGSGRVRFLILDPHFTGLSTDLQTVLAKGWCGWKELSFWKENLPYNLCLPMLS